MQPLRAFCIASTISPSFSRRKGAIIIWQSLHQSNGRRQQQQPLFQNLECCFLFFNRTFWSIEQVFVCVAFFFFSFHRSLATSFLIFFTYTCVACKSCVVYLYNGHSVMTNECVICEIIILIWWYCLLYNFHLVLSYSLYLYSHWRFCYLSALGLIMAKSWCNFPRKILDILGL